EAAITLLLLRTRLTDEAIDNAVSRGSELDYLAIMEAIEHLRRAGSTREMVLCDVEVYRRIFLASRNLVLIWAFNTFSKIFLQLGERFPDLWQVNVPYLSGLDQMVGHMRDKKPERARMEMRRIFELRNRELLEGTSMMQ